MTEDFELVTNRKKIAWRYLTSWFPIDSFAIIPFEFLMDSTTHINQVARFSRLGRLFRVLKMTKLFRLLKFFKGKSKIIEMVKKFLNIQMGFDRLIFLITAFLIAVHLISCLWIFVPQLYEPDVELGEGSWLDD